jgi:hypothetical protein
MILIVLRSALFASALSCVGLLVLPLHRDRTFRGLSREPLVLLFAWPVMATCLRAVFAYMVVGIGLQGLLNISLFDIVRALQYDVSIERIFMEAGFSYIFHSKLKNIALIIS